MYCIFGFKVCVFFVECYVVCKFICEVFWEGVFDLVCDMGV